MKLEDMLAELRSLGWSVAVHNEYRLNGKFGTFWLFTHESGAFVKGESCTDGVAVAIVRAAVMKGSFLQPADHDLLFALRRAEALLMDGPAAEFLDEEAVKKMSRAAIEKAGGECMK